MFSEDQARNELEIHFQKFWDIAQRSFARHKKYPNRPIHRARTKANEISDLMIDEARKEFDGIGGIEFRELKGKELTLMEINGRILVWFKKLGRKRTSRNVLTAHVRQILNGRLPDLPGISPAAVILIVGYTLNLDETKVFRVSVVPPTSKKKPEWYIDIEDAEGGVSEMPKPTPTGGNPGRRSRIVVKSSPQQITLTS